MKRKIITLITAALWPSVSWPVPGQRRMEILMPETPGTSKAALSHVSHLAATRIARLTVVGRS